MTARVRYNEELDWLHGEVIRMGEMAKDMVRKGVQSFLASDVVLRDEVVRLDHEIYHQEQVIEKHCVELIARYQPVASDLRTVTTCLKIITDLNRIGRYGRDIAELSDHYDPGFRRLVTIPLMADLAVAMVSDSINYFVVRDVQGAVELKNRDDEVDSLWNTIFRESLTYMIEDPRNITIGTHFILLARYLERIADHACNIGDRVVFMVSGERPDPYGRKKRPERIEKDAANRYQGRETPTDGHYSMPLEDK